MNLKVLRNRFFLFVPVLLAVLATSAPATLVLILAGIALPTKVHSQTCAWQTLAPLPAPRSVLYVAEVNGRLFAFGGRTGCFYGGPATAYADVYEYLFDTNVWVSRAPMPAPRADRAVGVVKGKVYLFGGDCCLNTPTYVYDTATDSWSTASPMPTPRGNPGVVVVNDIIYVVGGWSGSPSCCATGVTEAYNPATDTWT
ncbi:MAG: kelch repeat-containing protein, partial [Armatimonadota bacterium]